MQTLTDRQKREIEYHKAHAATAAQHLENLNFDVVSSPDRRWWNAYWDIWTFFLGVGVSRKKVLVVGCGSGTDALLFAKLGANVAAFDLSSDMVSLGTRSASENGLSVEFAVMPAEAMDYPDNTFDIVFARDILHHVDIPNCMEEIVRVSKPDALLVVDEIYSHSFTDIIRRSWLVERLLYPLMQNFIYKRQQPYITADERKMSESDIAHVKSALKDLTYHKYFNFIVTRIIPDKYTQLNKLDRILLIALGGLGYFLAGRIAFAGHMQKHGVADSPRGQPDL